MGGKGVYEGIVIETEATVGNPMFAKDKFRVEAEFISDLVPGGKVASGLLIENLTRDMLSLTIECEASDDVGIDILSPVGIYPGEVSRIEAVFTAPIGLVPGRKVSVTYRVYEASK